MDAISFGIWVFHFIQKLVIFIDTWGIFEFAGYSGIQMHPFSSDLEAPSGLYCSREFFLFKSRYFGNLVKNRKIPKPKKSKLQNRFFTRKQKIMTRFFLLKRRVFWPIFTKKIFIQKIDTFIWQNFQTNELSDLPNELLTFLQNFSKDWDAGLDFAQKINFSIFFTEWYKFTNFQFLGFLTFLKILLYKLRKLTNKWGILWSRRP